MILESTGGWHKLSFNDIRTLADHIASRTNNIESRLFLRISLFGFSVVFQ
jgi:hypothetical protein